MFQSSNKHLVLLILLLAAPGLDASDSEVVAVVSAQHSEVELTMEEVVDLFLGHAQRYPDGRRAIPVDQSENSPQRSEFYSRHAGMTPAQLKRHWSRLIFTGRGRPPEQVGDANAVKARLAQDPNAIGYIDRDMVDESVIVVAPSSSGSADGES